MTWFGFLQNFESRRILVLCYSINKYKSEKTITNNTSVQLSMLIDFLTLSVLFLKGHQNWIYHAKFNRKVAMEVSEAFALWNKVCYYSFWYIIRIILQEVVWYIILCLILTVHWDITLCKFKFKFSIQPEKWSSFPKVENLFVVVGGMACDQCTHRDSCS